MHLPFFAGCRHLCTTCIPCILDSPDQSSFFPLRKLPILATPLSLSPATVFKVSSLPLLCISTSSFLPASSPFDPSSPVRPSALTLPDRLNMPPPALLALALPTLLPLCPDKAEYAERAESSDIRPALGVFKRPAASILACRAVRRLFRANDDGAEVIAPEAIPGGGGGMENRFDMRFANEVGGSSPDVGGRRRTMVLLLRDLGGSPAEDEAGASG